MHHTHLLLLMLICLSYTTNSSIYYVVPDNHYLATNDNTLKHYLDNFEKYFTSHTQLVFLPGKHHLHTDLAVQNVINFTLEGFGQKEMSYTLVYCTELAQVAISNSYDINIRYLNFSECGVSKVKDLILPRVALDIFDCSNISLLSSMFMCQYQQCGLAVVNAMRNTLVKNSTSSYLLLVYNITRSNGTMEILNFNHKRSSSHNHTAIEILFYEHSQFIKVKSWIKL